MKMEFVLCDSLRNVDKWILYVFDFVKPKFVDSDVEMRRETVENCMKMPK